MSSKRPTQADILIDLAKASVLFHTPDGTGFADIDINGHRETWPIHSSGFKDWLTRSYFKQTDGAPSSEAMRSAIGVIQSRARFDGPELVVHIRVAELNGRFYLDLGDATWRAVEIDTGGWRIIQDPPVRFRHPAGMQPLPVPVSGGSIATLRPLLNVQSDNDFVLVVAWLLACLRNRGPYPILIVCGEQGSAKSNFTAIMRSLLDPNTAPLRTLPRDARDLFIAASNGHVLAFDNVSRSCRIGFRTPFVGCRLVVVSLLRQLYTNQEEVLFDAARPVLLNGIEDMVTRPDLADRALFLTLEAIPENRRRPQAELWAAFEAERPRILGVLLDAVVEGLKRLPATRISNLPRMADFALWATACETALWPAGTLGAAYKSNRDEAIEAIIEADPVAAAVRTLMQTRTVWTGTATDLLGALTKVVGVARSKIWPDSPEALSNRVRRAATFLRKGGIEIVFFRLGRGRTRTIKITNTNTQPSATGKGPSAPSAPGPSAPSAPGRSGFRDPSVPSASSGSSPYVRTPPGNGQDDGPDWGTALLRTVRTQVCRSNLENRPRRNDRREPSAPAGSLKNRKARGDHEPTRKRV